MVGQRVSGVLVVHPGAEDQPKDFTVAIDNGPAGVTLADQSAQRIGFALDAVGGVNIRPVDGQAVTNARVFHIKGPTQGVPEHGRIGPRRRGHVIQLQRAQAQVHSVQHRDILVGVEIRDGGNILTVDCPQLDLIRSGNHVGIGHHGARRDHKTAAFQHLSALLCRR